MTHPDVNDELRRNGEDAVRERLAKAKPFDPNDDSQWSNPDQSLLEDRRGDLPAFPSDTLPRHGSTGLPKRRVAPG